MPDLDEFGIPIKKVELDEFGIPIKKKDGGVVSQKPTQLQSSSKNILAQRPEELPLGVPKVGAAGIDRLFSAASEAKSKLDQAVSSRDDIYTDIIKENRLKQLDAESKAGLSDMVNPALKSAKMGIITQIPVTPKEIQSQKDVATTNPNAYRDILKRAAKKDPEIAKNAYLVDAEQRAMEKPEAAEKILQNADKIANGDLNYNVGNGVLQKPEGAFVSLYRGLQERNRQVEDYDFLTKTLNDGAIIAQLEDDRTRIDPDEPQPTPSGALAEFGMMAGMEGIAMTKSAAAGLATGLVPGAQAAAPYVAAFAASPEYYQRGYSTALRAAYNEFRQRGDSEYDALQKAREQAETEANLSAAEGFASGFIGAKIGAKPTGFTVGKGFNNAIKNTLVASKNFVTENLVEGGTDAAIAGGLQIAKNISAFDKGLDRGVFDGVQENVVGELAFSFGLGAITKAAKLAINPKDLNTLVTGVARQPKEVVDAKLGEMVVTGQADPEEVANAGKLIDEARKVDSQIPSTVQDEDTRVVIGEKIKEREALKAELATANEAFHKDIRDKIQNIDNEILNYATTEGGQQIQEVTAEGNISQPTGVVQGQREGGIGEGLQGQAEVPKSDVGDSNLGSEGKITPDQITVSNDSTDFASQMQSAQSSLGKAGMSVSPYTQEAYDEVASEGGKFLRAAGNKVLALLKSSGEMVSLVKDATVKSKGAAQAMISKMKDMGGLFMDNYDIYLTPIYEKAGYKVVARVPFDEQYAPEGWNDEDSPLKNKPDVVFMVRNDIPAQEQSFTNYDDAQNYVKGIVDSAVSSGIAKTPSQMDIETELTKELIKEPVAKVQQSLKSAGITVDLIPDTAEFDRRVQQLGGQAGMEGVFLADDGKVLLNEQKLKEGTNAGRIIFHEATHPIINIIRNTNPELYNRVVAGINAASDNPAIQQAKAWVESNKNVYDTDVKKEDETLVETIAMVGDGTLDLNTIETGFKQALIEVINTIARALGFKPVLKDTDVAAFKKLAAQIADVLTSGRDIAEVVGKENVREFKGPSLQEKAVTVAKGTETLKRFGLPEGRNTTRKIGEALESRTRDKYGIIGRNDRSESALKTISSWMSEEVKYFIDEFGENSGKGWYGEKFQKGIDKMAEVFPELATDQNARDLFTMLVAITSDGTEVMENFKQASKAYEYYKNNGKMPETASAQRAASYEIKFGNIQRLLDENNGDVAAIKKYLLNVSSISKLNKQRKTEGLKALTTSWPASFEVPVAASIFGPKLGMFYANLSGMENYPTLDRWWSRTFNRYRGTLIPQITRGFNKKGEALGIDAYREVTDMQSASEDEVIARIIQDHDSYESKGYKKGTVAEKKANTLYKKLFIELNDAPFGKSDRKFMYDAFVRTKKRLKASGIDVSIADVQAILWYFEKNLYKKLGVTKPILGISYEEAAAKTVDRFKSNGGTFNYQIKEEDKGETIEEIDDVEVQESEGGIGTDERGQPIAEGTPDPIDPSPIQASAGRRATEEDITGKVGSKLIDDGQGNYVFFHYSPNSFKKVNPRKFGSNLFTGRDEQPGVNVSMFYVSQNDKEGGLIWDYLYISKIPKGQVYPFNEDPLGLIKEAKAEFVKQYGSKAAFDPNKQLGFVTKVAADRGFPMTVAKWTVRGKKTFRAQTSESLPVEYYQRIKSGTMNQIETNPKYKGIKFDKSVKTPVQASAGNRLAPNGKPSNLTEKQYQQVRTPEFKNWFGDWENDPANASKVVDENGEPLVVYHGTNVKEDFDTFKGTDYIFFAKDAEFASEYARAMNGRVVPAFVNAKKIFDPTEMTQSEEDDIFDIIEKEELNRGANEDRAYDIAYQTIKRLTNKVEDNWLIAESDQVNKYIKSKGYDALAVRETGSENIAVIEPNQIKSATANVGTFSTEDARIQFSAGNRTINWEKSKEGKGDPSISSRNPIVLEAAQNLKAGKITNEEYRATVSENSPITPITRFFEPATEKEITNALSSKLDKVNSPIEEDTVVGLRLDIPAYKNKNTWVVSVHEGRTDQGPILSYRNVGRITDVTFEVRPQGGLGIAAGKEKTTIARMYGNWKNLPGKTMEEQGENAKELVQNIVNDPSYVQVGMNPFRHSYFYDRSSDMGRPVVSADEVVQIGGLVYAKNPVYGNWTDEAYRVKGLFDSAGKSVQFSAGNREIINGFYSPIQKRVNEFKQPKASVQKWKEIVGTKTDEAVFSGLADWLGGMKPDMQLTKEDVNNFMSENRIEIEEVDKSDDTKYEAYQLPGGENYKEILITLPGKDQFKSSHFDETNIITHLRMNTRTDVDGNKVLFLEEVQSDWGQQGKKEGFKRDVNEQEQKQIDSLKKEKQNLLNNLKSYQLLKSIAGPEINKIDGFRNEDKVHEFLQVIEVSISGIIDNPYYDASNKSDVKRGKQRIINDINENVRYWTRNNDSQLELSDQNILDIIDAYNEDSSYGRAKKKRLSAFEKIDKINSEIWSIGYNATKSRTLPAPYVTNTNAWVKLGLKVALKEAIRQGADRIAWTTGQQQNERYDLRKQVDEVTYKKLDGDNYRIVTYKGGNALERQDVPESGLEVALGKDVADRIISGVGDVNENTGITSLSGLNLSVGGKGMKDFYGDAQNVGIVGKVAKALVKELTGKEGEIVASGLSKEANQDVINRYNRARQYGNVPEALAKEYEQARGVKSEQPAIDITPELVQAVEGGLPQFSAGNRPENNQNFKLAAFVMRKKAEGATDGEIAIGIASVTGMKPEDIKAIIDNPEQFIRDSFPSMSKLQQDNLIQKAKIQDIYRTRQFGKPIDKPFMGLEVPQEMVDDYLDKTGRADRNVKEWAKDFKRKWLDPAKGLPDWTLAIKDFATGAKNIEVARAANTIQRLKDTAKQIGFKDWDAFSEALVMAKDVQRFIPNESGITPFDAYRAAANRTFTAQDDQLPALVPDAIKKLPDEIIPFAYAMRGQIDNLTRDLIGSGYVTPEQAVTLEKNLGAYTNRAYKIFSERGYVPEKKVYNAAVKFLAEQKIPAIANDNVGVLTDKQIVEKAMEEAKKDVEAILSKKKNPYFGSKSDRRDTGILQERKDIPEPIRDLMGQYTDPGTVFIMTVAKQAALKSASQYLNKLRTMGMGSLFFERNDPSRPASHSVEVAAKGTESMNPLGGLYTTPEIAEAISMVEPTYNELTQAWMKLVGMVRWGKTVGSVATQFKNLLSNGGFAVLNGYMLSGENTQAFKAAAKYVKGQYSPKEIDAITDKAIRLNLVGQSVGMRELKEMLGSGDVHDIALDIALNPEGKWGKRVAKRVDVLGAANKLYRLGDDIWKVYAYMVEREQISDARFNGAKYDSLTKQQQEQVDLESSDRVKNTWPTYDRVVEGAKFVSKRAPIFGNFISFQAESLRALTNSIKLAKQDLSDPQMRHLGVRRMAGISAYIGLRSAITIGVSKMAGFAAAGVLGSMFGDDEEERNKRAIKEALPTFMRTGDLAVVQGDKPHQYTVVNLSSLDPYGVVSNSLNAFTEGREGIFGRTMEPGVLAAGTELFSGFLEPEMTFQTMWSVINNKDPKTGEQLVMETDTDLQASAKVAAKIWDQLEPSTVAMVQRLLERENKSAELLALGGARPYDVDLHKSFGFVLSRFGKDIDAINKEYNRIKYDDKMTAEDKEAAEKVAEDNKAFAISKVSQIYRDFINIGADPKVLNELINQKSAVKVTGYDKNTKNSIKTGKISKEKLFK